MKLAVLMICVVAALGTLAIAFLAMDGPITLMVLGFLAWDISPYLGLALLSKWIIRHAATIAVLLLALLIGLFGIWALVDAMYIHPDAQGAIVFVIVPAMQWVGLLLALLPLYLLNRVGNR